MMPDQTSEKAEVKMYSDFKSPYAYLAFDPGMALRERFDVRVRWIPFQLRLKGKGERSVYSEYKVKYSYMDARRWAKPRGLRIRGPLKIYDTTQPRLAAYLLKGRADCSSLAGWPSRNFFFANSKPIRRKTWLG